MASKKNYWKSFEELTDNTLNEKLTTNEFAEEIPVDNFLGNDNAMENSQTSRRDFLKMATCFSQGAQIDQVKQSLNLSNERVLNFVACAVLLQLGQFIDQNEVKYQADTQQVETGQMNKLRGFIGKLRRKLGL